jgi:hypothetical protein
MDGTDMNRIIVIAASGLALAGCTSSGGMTTDWLPKFEPKPVDIQLVSAPPGAEAKSTTGQSCQTPCTLQMPPDKDFQVTFSLANYQPQTISVQPVKSEETWETSLQPNPVEVQLVATTPPKRGQKRAAASAPRAAAARPAAKPATPPPAATAPAPAAPAGSDPWPQVR